MFEFLMIKRLKTTFARNKKKIDIYLQNHHFLILIDWLNRVLRRIGNFSAI